MNDTRLLIGSLSNDLGRISACMARGSYLSAQRFADESTRWTSELSTRELPAYIRKIVADVHDQKSEEITIEIAEKYLMYSVLLQNFSLHLSD